MSAGYLAINAVFGLAYVTVRGGITGARPGNFADAFFFSVRPWAPSAMARCRRASLYGNLVMTPEVFVGLFNLAIATGLLFARISRPTARIMFSNMAVVTAFEGGRRSFFGRPTSGATLWSRPR